MPRARSRHAPSSGAPRERKKKGPKPFPGTRRKRCDLRVPPSEGIKRAMTRHTKKRKTQVLTWLLHHRIAERRTKPTDIYHAVRSRTGEALISYEEMRDRKIVWEHGGMVYRTPTYHEAEKFWRITAGTIVAWWKNKEKYLPAEEIERINKHHPLTGRTYDPIPNMPTSQRPPAPDGAPGSQSTPIELDGDDDLNDHPDAAAERDAEAEEDEMEDDDDDDDDDIDEDEDEDEEEHVEEDMEDVDDIENTQEFRDLQEDLEDALGEDDPDEVAQAT